MTDRIEELEMEEGKSNELREARRLVRKRNERRG